MQRLFVYGTLRRGGPRHAVLLRARPRRAEAGSICGRLLDLGDYPGWVPGRGQVMGELYEFDTLRALLPVLDEIEGSRFRRVRVMVETACGRVAAWGYQWTGGPGAGPPIPSGDWFHRD